MSYRYLLKYYKKPEAAHSAGSERVSQVAAKLGAFEISFKALSIEEGNVIASDNEDLTILDRCMLFKKADGNDDYFNRFHATLSEKQKQQVRDDPALNKIAFKTEEDSSDSVKKALELSMSRLSIDLGEQDQQWKLIKLLMQYGAPFDDTDENGKSLLHHAAESGLSEMINWLAKKMANVNLRDKNELTPFHDLARKQGVGPALQLLVCGGDYQCKTSSGLTPAHVAMANGNIDLFELLEALGIDVRSYSKHAGSIVDAGFLNERSMKYLQERQLITNVNINMPEAIKNIILTDNPEAFELLTPLGFHKDYDVGEGVTALVFAAFHKKTNTMAYLITSQAELGFDGPNELNPLIISINKGNINGCKLLLSKFLEKYDNTRNEELFLLAAASGYVDVVRMLEMVGIVGSEPKQRPRSKSVNSGADNYIKFFANNKEKSAQDDSVYITRRNSFSA